jgi:ATP-dependent helicase/nuclease subunit A
MAIGGRAMIKKAFAPTPEQLRASDPKNSVWVSANAGSGKTHVLVERVMRLLLAGAEPKTILCITYTKAAAAEMSDRLFTRLSEWTNLEEPDLALSLNRLGEDGNDQTLRKRARRLFAQALETPGGLKIQTIHAFCEKVLHLFPVEAGMSPGFSVMDERRETELQSQATNLVLAHAESASEGELGKAFLALSDLLNNEQFQFLISDFIYALRKLDAELLSFSKAKYGGDLIEALGLSHTSLREVHEELASIDREAYKHHAKNLSKFGAYRSADPSEKMHEIAEAANPVLLLEKFFFTEGKPRKDQISKVAATAQPEAKAFIDAEKFRLEDLLQKRGSFEISTQSANAFVLAKAILNHVAEEKQRLGLYDFHDLISRAANLLSTARATQWVVKKLDENLSHILVDEAQDTSPDQWRIVRALSEEFFSGEGRHKPGSRSLFIVGDQKQSIFSFQGADAQGFGATQAKLSAQSAGQLKSVELTISYRSTVNILKAVDRVFPPEKLQQLGITHANATERGHTASRQDEEGVVELWPFLDPEDEDAKPEAWTKPVDRPPETSPQRKLAKHIALKIQTWLHSNVPRMLQNGKNEKLDAGDILILFQTRGELYRMVLAELRKREIPVAGADRLKLLESLIVQDLLMLLSWLLLPQDDHALAVILKSPLVLEPLTEEQLFDLSHNRGTKRLSDLLEGKNATYVLALQTLAKSSGPFAVLSTIITRSRKAIALRLGSEALEATNAMLDLALDYEAEHGVSVFGFLRWFSATETVLKRDMDKAKGEVRLMTVHGAKGLESKVVIIADATYVKQPWTSRPSVIAAPIIGRPVWKVSGVGQVTANMQAWFDIHVNELQQERNRLLYVAMTRAADELYICGIKGKNKVGDTAWWPTITQALGEPDGDQPKRIGAPDILAQVAENQSAKKPEATPWLFESPEPEANQASAMRSPSGDQSTMDVDAARRGTALHQLLQDIVDTSEARRFSMARQRAIVLGLSEADATNLCTLVSREDLKIYFGESGKSEVDVMGILPNGRQVSGRIDRLVTTPDGIWILDYKSNKSGPERLSPIHPYVRQLAHYVALLREIYAKKPIHAALLWTETGELQPLPEPLITAALQEIEHPVT